MPPLAADLAHPYVPNNNSEGRQPTDRIGDLSNPNLKQWVKDGMKEDIEDIVAGKIAFKSSSSCVPSGIPLHVFMAASAFRPISFKLRRKS